MMQDLGLLTSHVVSSERGRMGCGGGTGIGIQIFVFVVHQSLNVTFIKSPRTSFSR